MKKHYKTEIFKWFFTQIIAKLVDSNVTNLSGLLMGLSSKKKKAQMHWHFLLVVDR